MGKSYLFVRYFKLIKELARVATERDFKTA
jgi:hypothetical protein